MDTERKQIVQTFLGIVNHISDKDYQKRAWIKGEEADFDETCCVFFGIGDSIIEKYKDFEITEDQYQLLKKFRDELEKFSDNNDLPQLFIDTPEWTKITLMAKKVLEVFNYHN